MKLQILLFLLFITCFNNKIDGPKEDISDLVELSLNSCNNTKQYYHFEIKEHRNINIIFKKIHSPLTRQIKCYGIIVNNGPNIDTKGNLIEVIDYKSEPNKFYILYKIVNQGVIVKTTMEHKNGKWELTNCNIVEV